MPIALPGVLAPVNYVHLPPFCPTLAKRGGSVLLGFPTPFPLVLMGLFSFVSLAGKYIPYPVIYELFTKVNGLNVLRAYPAVPTLVAKQLLKVLLVKVVNRLASQVF